VFGGSLTADPVVAVQHQQRVSVEVFDVLNPFRVEVSGAFDSGDASFSLGPDIPELERSTAVGSLIDQALAPGPGFLRRIRMLVAAASTGLSLSRSG